MITIKARRPGKIVEIWLLAAAALTVVPAAQAIDPLEEPVSLKVSSFKVGSSWYVYGVTLGELLRKHFAEGSIVDTPPGGGGTANPLLVARGKADLGLGFGVVNNWAQKGQFFYDQPLGNIRGLVGGLDSYYLGITANEPQAPDTLEAYVQHRPDANVLLLKKGSFGSYAGEQVLDLVGASQEAVSSQGGNYTFTDFNTVKSAFASGRGDLFIQVMTRGQPTFTELAETRDISFLQLTDETLDGMEARYGWNTGTLPAGIYRSQELPLRLPLTTTSIIASAELDDSLAYGVVKTICENQDAFKAGHKALSEFDCATLAWNEELIGLPLHDGAARYYREQGWIQ
uniref:TAXI family TRAP transporter solute-binding subunit n=1 Tax=Marinobacterium profundum TaxID=1714300 RepID=UPI00082C57D0|nr:TAXI family TRAP transporter solute-binding subunit [Marinobacterium profundum]